MQDYTEIDMNDLMQQMNEAVATGFPDEQPKEDFTKGADDLTLSNDLTGDVLSSEDLFNMMQDEYTDDDHDEPTTKEPTDYNDSLKLDADTYYTIGDAEYATEEIETAVKSLDAFKNFEAQKEAFRSNMQEVCNYLDTNEFISNSEFEQSIHYWQEQMDSAKGREEWQLAKHNKDRAEARSSSAKAEFAKMRERVEAGKKEQEALEAQQVVNELVYRHGWNNDDFGDAVKYINDNGVKIDPKQASASLLMTIRKAAAYDKSRSNKEIDLDRKVKSLVGSPVSSKNLDQVMNRADESTKRRIESKLDLNYDRGMSAQDRLDIFANLKD